MLMENEARSYRSQFQQNLPDAEIIQSGFESDLGQKYIETAFLAELGLDVQMAAGFPTVDERNDMVRVGERFQGIHFPDTALTVPQSRVWLFGLLDSPYSVGQRIWGLWSGWREGEDRGLAMWLSDPEDLREFTGADEFHILETRRQGWIDVGSVESSQLET